MPARLIFVDIGDTPRGWQPGDIAALLDQHDARAHRAALRGGDREGRYLHVGEKALLKDCDRYR